MTYTHKTSAKTYKKLRSHKLNTTAAMIVTTQMLELKRKKQQNTNYRSKVKINMNKTQCFPYFTILSKGRARQVQIPPPMNGE